MISVVTVSKRRGWEQIAKESLQNQTYKDFEWVVVTEEAYSHSSLQSWGNIKVTHLVAPKKKQGNYSNLNASNNTALRNCKGDYVIFYQDFIILEPDCLEKLVTMAEPKVFATTLTKNPEGVEEDPRYLWVDAIRPCQPEEWEENVGMAPMAILRELGGYDEEYDQGWAWNNCNVAERAQMLGCRFYIDESNRPQLIYHKKEPDLNPDMPLNGDFHVKRMADIRANKFPLKLTYL